MIGVPEPRLLLVHRCQAAERAEEVRRVGRGAGYRACGQRRILVLRQERRPDVHGVQINRAVAAALECPQAIEAVIADIGDVERHRPWQRDLHAALPVPR